MLNKYFHVQIIASGNLAETKNIIKLRRRISLISLFFCNWKIDNFLEVTLILFSVYLIEFQLYWIEIKFVKIDWWALVCKYAIFGQSLWYSDL